MNEYLTFSQALDCLKSGEKIARSGWNGKDMYLQHVIPIHKIPEGGTNHVACRITGSECDKELLPWIGMKTADNKFVPWLASQTDILAEDWFIIE